MVDAVLVSDTEAIFQLVSHLLVTVENLNDCHHEYSSKLLLVSIAVSEVGMQ